jgi:parallel beta-helix repeat protein
MRIRRARSHGLPRTAARHPWRAPAALALVASLLSGGAALQPVSAATTKASIEAPPPPCDPTFVPADAPQIPSRISHCPGGTTFTFAAGVYRMRSKIIPQPGDVLIGAGSGAHGTRFTGSSVIKTWTRSGSLWVHKGDAKKVGIMPDSCEKGRACAYQDWLYRDGDWMRRILEPCRGLGPNDFCIDYNAKKIWIGSSPGQSLFEYGTVTQFLVGYRFGDVTAEHFSYDEFATVGGALQGGAGWFVDDVHGHHNHACGVSLLHSSVQDPATVQNSTFDHNGYHGYCNPGDSPSVLGNDIGYNNALGFAHGTGMVLNGAQRGLVRDNWVHDNDGVGIDVVKRASDVGSTGVAITQNRITGNSGTGIRVFNSCAITVDSNDIDDNMGFGIDVAGASDNLISNNTVSVPPTDLRGGIRIYARHNPGRNNCGLFDDARNNTVTGNDITMGVMKDRGNFGNINGTVNVGGFVSGERFIQNRYHVPGGDCSVSTWKWWDGSAEQESDFSGWQNRYDQDPPPAGRCGS